MIWRLCTGKAGHFLQPVVTRVADGVPVYVVKNEHTRKKKVLLHSRLLLWLADFGEPCG